MNIYLWKTLFFHFKFRWWWWTKPLLSKKVDVSSTFIEIYFGLGWPSSVLEIVSSQRLKTKLMNFFLQTNFVRERNSKPSNLNKIYHKNYESPSLIQSNQWKLKIFQNRQYRSKIKDSVTTAMFFWEHRASQILELYSLSLF